MTQSSPSIPHGSSCFSCLKPTGSFSHQQPPETFSAPRFLENKGLNVKELCEISSGWVLCFHGYQWVFLKLRHEITKIEQIFVVGNSGKHFEIILVKCLGLLV
ncbi:hypothetical protein I3843_09G178300 [Carya illinoinensis]|nr:hypothetical protein I3843_09G178300 [Carya illinoinensis]